MWYLDWIARGAAIGAAARGAAIGAAARGAAIGAAARGAAIEAAARGAANGAATRGAPNGTAARGAANGAAARPVYAVIPPAKRPGSARAQARVAMRTACKKKYENYDISYFVSRLQS